MEAAIRSSIQAGQPPSGQRTDAHDNGASTHIQNQPGGGPSQSPRNMSSYQQRIPTGASPIHRPVETPQTYSKVGIGAPQPPTSRSATSPLSPPRPVPGATTAYARFADVTSVREAPQRYVQQSPYSIGPMAQYRENPYARIPQMPPQAQDFNRANMSVSPANSLESNQMPPIPMQMTKGGRIVNPTPVFRHFPNSQPQPSQQQQQQHQQVMNEYPVNSVSSRQPAQAPQPLDTRGQPYKKLRLVDTNSLQPVSSIMHPSQQQQLQQQQQPPQQQPLLQSKSLSPSQPKQSQHSQLPPASVNQISNQTQNLNRIQNQIQQPQSALISIPPTQQLKVDTRESQPLSTEAYHPQVEAISPTLPDNGTERRNAKDDLINNISKVDSEIENVETKKKILLEEVKGLEEAATKPSKIKEEDIVQPKKHQSLAQKIYDDNRKKAFSRHSIMLPLGPPVELPLYNQPCDVEVCENIIAHYNRIKPQLLLHVKRIKLDRAIRNASLVEKYAQLSQEWQKRIEKIESSAKRKAKEAKNREIFEKVFTELRKQREEKERFNRVGSRVKSEADLEEIMDGLQEQALEDKKMRSYAVIPPLMLDQSQRKIVFENENGAVSDMTSISKDRQNFNVWTTGEKEIFKEKFLQHPKNFGAIAASLDRKSVQDCVRYYYLSKKTENYKQLLRKSRQRTRSSRNPQKTQQVQTQCIVDSLTTGVTTRLQREQQQKTNGSSRDRPGQTNNSTPAKANANTATPASTPAKSAAPTTMSTTTTTATTSEASTTNSISLIPAPSLKANVSETVSVTNSETTSVTTAISTSISSSSSSKSADTKPAVATTTDNLTDATKNNVSNLVEAVAPSLNNEIAATPAKPATEATVVIGGEVNENSKLKTPMDGVEDFFNNSHSDVNHKKSAQNGPNANNVSSEPSNDSKQTPADAVITITEDGLKSKAVKNNLEDTEVNLDVSEAKKKRLDSDNVDAASAPNTLLMGAAENHVDNKEKQNSCFICKAEDCFRTRPLKKGRGQQYGIPDDTIPVGARVCNLCQCKSVRNRYPNCPLPTCPNSKDRARRLHNIPGRLYDLAPEIRDPIIQEFQIPPNPTRCCSACLMRIRRKLDPHTSTPEDHRRTGCDDSDFSSSSCDERECGSDTTSIDSPNNPLQPNAVHKDEKKLLNASKCLDPKPLDDRLHPPLSQAPKKPKMSEEYDSSATETADEENENSPANRQSPKVVMVPPSSVQNGPPRSGEQQLNVRDFVFTFIERQLKTPCSAGSKNNANPSKEQIATMPQQQPAPHNANHSPAADVREREPLTFAREFSKEKTPTSLVANSNFQQTIQMRPPMEQAPSQRTPENDQMPPVVNPHPLYSQQIISHPSGISATITPVKAQPPPVPMMTHDLIRSEPEPQTLDLSIKKSTAPTHHVSSMSTKHTSNPAPIYRSEPTPPPHPTQREPGYMPYHHPAEMNRPTKSPSIYVSQVPVQPGNWMSQQPLPGGRSQQPTQLPQSHSQMQQSSHSQMQQNKVKNAPKLSPKIHQQSPSPSQISLPGPKAGSITHGTPLNNSQQMLSPRFDGILRQTPPSNPENNKLGSITQGTPIHLPVHHNQDKQRAFEYYKNRQSPAQPVSSQAPQQTPPAQSPQSQSFASSPYGRPPYPMEQPPLLSSRQIVMHDFMTSQQMQGQQRNVSRSDKESPTPRNSNMGSPALVYYTDKDRNRSDYIIRTSPAEPINSTPSPHRTPPPQRQGVIQRHNTSGSKPPSPLPNVMQHSYTLPGHEAFSKFVDVAVQQPQLPVPQKEEKRSHPDHSPAPSHHEIRYHQMARDHAVMQFQQQQFRQQQQQAADMQRRQEQYTLNRMHAQQERERERERERMERERDRERERERRERREREEIEREERRRDSTRFMEANCNPANPPYLRADAPPPIGMSDREREAYNRAIPGRPPAPADGTTFSAKSLIDAIIKHSINQGASDPPLAAFNREGTRAGFYPSSRDIPQSAAHPSSLSSGENNGKLSSPNIINIDLDSDRGAGPPPAQQQQSQPPPPPQQQGNLPPSQIAGKHLTLTIGDLTDSLIAKDYGSNTFLTYNPDSLKYMRMQQQKEVDSGDRSKNHVQIGNRQNPPDERQIIRMAQPPSPRGKYPHEMVMPPDPRFYPPGGVVSVSANLHPGLQHPHDRRGPPPSSSGGQSHQFALDYVKNRIAEAMRTGVDHHEQHPGKEQDKIESNMNSSRDSRIPSSSYQPVQAPPVTTFATTTYAYPYSALNVSGPPSAVLTHQPSKSLETSHHSSQHNIRAEPKPLLSAQYEALSDEE